WEFPGRTLTPVHTALGYHFERKSGSSNVLFVGDSHMEQYYPRIDRLLSENPDSTRGVLFVTERSCLPIHRLEGSSTGKCVGLVENALHLANDPRVDTVVIGAAWNRYEIFQSPEREKAFTDLAAIIATFRRMGRRVYLILPIPRGDPFDPSNLVSRSIF